MNKELVMVLTDIMNELGADELIDNILNMYADWNEGELIKAIKELLELDGEHSVTEAVIRIHRDFNYEQLSENEVLVFRGNEFEYKDFLLSLFALLMLVDKPKRPILIQDAAFSLLAIDRELAEQFKDDVAQRVYYQYLR